MSVGNNLREIRVIDDTDLARLLLDPLRSRVLAALTVPGSASTVAAQLGETRQKVNHHLRTLEEHGLVELVEERPRRGLTERIVVATADALLFAPELAGHNAPNVRESDRDEARWSTRYLLAVAARLLSEVGSLAHRARAADQPLATLTIDTEIRFSSAAERARFTEALADAVQRLAAEFHDEHAVGGRRHRLIICAHPTPTTEEPS